MRLTRAKKVRTRKRPLCTLGVILILVFVLASIAVSYWAVIAEPLENGSRVEEESEFTYHGLHYYSDTRTVSFKAVNVQAGCDLVAGIVTRIPSLGDVERMDFYNTGRISEGLINKDSTIIVLEKG